MGRYTPNKSYGHSCQSIGYQTYRISWVIDRYYQGSRLRFPTRFIRDTDRNGAKKFCKKWGIDFNDSFAKEQK